MHKVSSIKQKEIAADSRRCGLSFDIGESLLRSESIDC